MRNEQERNYFLKPNLAVKQYFSLPKGLKTVCKKSKNVWVPHCQTFLPLPISKCHVLFKWPLEHLQSKILLRPCVRQFFPIFLFLRVSEIAVFWKLGSVQVFWAFSELVPTRENSSRLVPTLIFAKKLRKNAFFCKIKVGMSRKLPFF